MNITKLTSTPSRRPLAAIAVPALLGMPLLAAAGGGQDPCEKASLQTYLACGKAAAGDFWIQRAKCTNLPTFQERLACTLEALDEYEEALDLCEEQLDARFDVCAGLGGGIYHPEIDPDDFVELVDNPYFPLLPGTKYIYEKETDEGIERVEVSVSGETKEILGVECTEVRDVVFLDGELVEDTLDWFAQDECGDVWYFGEIAKDFEDGELVSLGGSWTAGKDGAKPGTLMLGDPHPGDFYRQEFLVGEAEDVAGVLSTNAKVSVPYGSFTHCLKTEDLTPLSPDGLEHKFYAPGIGLVLEVDVDSGERLELIEIVYE